MPLWVHHLLATISFLLTLLFVSSILRARRAAGSTVAWLIAICIIPYVGIPLYLIFSSRKFPSRLSRKSKIYKPSASNNALDDLPLIRKILRSSGVSDAKSNREMELLPTGVRAYDKLIELIQGAQTSIHVTTFIFGNDVVGKAVVEALTKKASAGVDVRVLVDSLGAALIRHPSFAKLKRAGGKIAYFMPVFHLPFRGRANLRNHRKLMVVDGKFALLGGMNLAQEYLGPTESLTRWVDLGLSVVGDCVTDLEDIFLQDWAYAIKDGRGSSLVSSSAPAGGKFLAQIVASGPDVLGDPLYDVLLSAINDAKSSIQIVTPYFIPDESLTKALELAVKRGVDIHVILPRRSNHYMADLARGSFIRELIAMGVEFDFFPRMIHAKAVLVDHTFAVLGSANFDMRSLLLNYELGIAIYSDEVSHSLAEWILKIRDETTQGIEKAGLWRELAEGVGRVLGPML